jgi:hypothetical protein
MLFVKGRALSRLNALRRVTALVGLALAGLVLAAITGGPASASDPLRLKEGFRLLKLTSYMRTLESGGHVFAVQNGSSQDLHLVLHRPPQNDLAIALGLQPASGPVLRLFSSDDREFASAPGASEKLRFNIPAEQVQTFFLPQSGGVASVDFYLWSPEALASHESNRQTFHSTVLLLLMLLLLLAIGVGLMVLLSSLWMRDILPDNPQFEWLLVNRLDSIRAALAIGVAMSLVAHLNLMAQQIVNRNYWTRVIIVSDMVLVAFGVFWVWQIYAPDFAGLISAELNEIALAMTCGTVLMGAIFVPDRRRA